MSEDPTPDSTPQAPLPPPRDPAQPETRSLDPEDARIMVVLRDIETKTLDP